MLTNIPTNGNTAARYSSDPQPSRSTQQDLTDAASVLKTRLEKNEKNRAALNELRQSGPNSVASEKAYAQKRLEQIEDMLRFAALLGLPASVIKSLSQELKGLVRQYHAAGSARDMDDISANDTGPTSIDQSTDETGNTVATDGDAEQPNVSVDATDTTSHALPDTSNIATSADQIRTATSAYLDIARSTAEKSSEAVADVDFMGRAKALMTRLKTLMKHTGEQQSSQEFELPIRP